MRTYTLSTTRATRADQHPSRSTKRAAFARTAVLAEFRPRDARAIDHGGFIDRRPCDEPVLLGDVAAEVVGYRRPLALTAKSTKLLSK